MYGSAGTEETSPPWTCEMTDHSVQFLQYRHPAGMHRCVSQPFLGEGYNYPPSPTELQQLPVHQHPQNMMPEPTFMYGYDHQPHRGVLLNPNYRNMHLVREELCRRFPSARSLDCADYEQGHSKMMLQQPPALNHMNQKSDSWKVEETSTDWKKKYEDVEKELRNTKEYMRDLNTKEDNLKREMELYNCQEKKHKLELRVTELESDAVKLRKRLSEKDLHMNRLEQKNINLKQMLERYRCEHQRLKDGQKRSFEKDEFQDVVAERDEILQQYERLQNTLAQEKSYRKELQQKHKKEVTELQENLSKERDSVISLNDDNVHKDNKIETLKKQMKECMTQKQLLLEELKELQEQVKSYADANTASEERKILEKQLLKEMVTAVYDLKNVVEFCIKDNVGEDMNVSLIVGTRAPSKPLTAFESCGNAEKFLSSQIHEVKDLRTEIHKLQETLSTNYAIRLGRELRL